MRLAMTMALAAMLLAAPVAAQEDVSTAVRSIPGLDAATLMEAEALDCAGLAEKVAEHAQVLTTLRSPEMFLPPYRVDYSAIEDPGVFEMFIESRLALYSVLAVENGCYPVVP